MSFINRNDVVGKVYAPGYFLAHEECERKTYQAAQASAVTASDGSKYVPMGTIYPSNDSNAIGIVYEDVDVTSGDMPASIVTCGVVYEDRLPAEISENAKTALLSKGFKFVADPSVTRPY